MNRNTQAIRTLAMIGAVLAYAGAVIYGDVMFLQTVAVAFPKSGIFASLAIAGALVTALSALVLPMALHWWFAPGLQFVWGVIFWAFDILALAMNSILAFQVASGGTIDPMIETWRAWSPATPMIAVIGWGIAFLLDPSHKIRHAQAELEADQVDVYAERLRAAAKSQDVTDVIVEAARIAAWNYAQRLNNSHLPISTKAEPSQNNHKRAIVTLNSESPQPVGPRRKTKSEGDNTDPKE